MKRRRERFEPVLGGIYRSGRYITTESAAAAEVLRTVNDVQRGSSPRPVCLLRESTECERAADADADERDTRDARCVYEGKSRSHREDPFAGVEQYLAMRAIVV